MEFNFKRVERDEILRTKLKASYSSWHDILSGVPQGSILGLLLFNIFLCDLFLMVENTDFASYADDNTPYTTGVNNEEVITKLEKKKLQDFLNGFLIT